MNFSRWLAWEPFLFLRAAAAALAEQRLPRLPAGHIVNKDVGLLSQLAPAPTQDCLVQAIMS